MVVQKRGQVFDGVSNQLIAGLDASARGEGGRGKKGERKWRQQEATGGTRREGSGRCKLQGLPQEKARAAQPLRPRFPRAAAYNIPAAPHDDGHGREQGVLKDELFALDDKAETALEAASRVHGTRVTRADELKHLAGGGVMAEKGRSEDVPTGRWSRRGTASPRLWGLFFFWGGGVFAALCQHPLFAGPLLP